MSANRTLYIYNNIFKKFSKNCEFDKPTKNIFKKIIREIVLTGNKELETATDDEIIATIVAFLESKNRITKFDKHLEKNILTCLSGEDIMKNGTKFTNVFKQYPTSNTNSNLITKYGGKKRKTSKKTTMKTKSVRCIAKTKAGKRCKHNTTHGKKCGHHRR